MSRSPALFHAPQPHLARLIEANRRFRRWLATRLLDGDVKFTPEGTIIGGSLCGRGEYAHRIRQRGGLAVDHNLIVDQGILKILGIALYSDAKLAAFYLALTSGNTPPAANLQASNFAATMGEITSTAEGYASATRPQWTPSAPANGVITSYDNKASFEIATSASVTITGAGLLSSNARGGQDGFLISATQFASPRELFNGETFDLGYQVSLTD